MLSSNSYLGCPCNVDILVQHVDNLNVKVVEQLNNSQELVMLKNYVQETNERLFLNSLKERVSEIGSWHWVLQDLFKRMDDAIVALKYESNAVNVVIRRLKDEVKERSLDGCKPGALCPRTDSVEESIMQEFNFLKCERKKFEEIFREIDKHILFLEKVKKRIENDILLKQEAITIDEECGKILESKAQGDFKQKKRKKRTPIEKWLNNCEKLKETGLNALRNAVAIRQQIRGARVQLSIGAQTFGARVDAVLRKRLHANTAKLEEMNFQREEALRDLRSLDEELASADKSIFETIEQEQIVIKRLEDRAKRPRGELTRDDVDKKLKAELASLRHFRKELRDNILRINRLQEQLKKAVSRLDDYAHDVVEVMNLDQHRIQSRMEEESQPLLANTTTSLESTRESNLRRTSEVNAVSGKPQSSAVESEPPHEDVLSGLSPTVFSVSAMTILNARALDTIREEEEMDFEDDYPVNF